MSGKKIWAYAKDINGCYIRSKDDSLKMFFIWEALKMRDNNIHDFNKLSFISTQNNPEKRSEMSVVKGGFYRYKKGVNNMPKTDEDSDSLSHAIAIQVLSEMECMKLVCGKKEIDLNFESIRNDDVKIQLTNKDRFSYYYPDIVCTFKDDSYYGRKWGGKLVIEVKHTHACEREKIKDFESHGIPIFEVDISTISIEKKFSTKTPTPSQMEDYYLYLKRCFKKQVFGKVVSDPVSVDFFNDFKSECKVLLKNKNDFLEGIEASLSIKEKEIKRKDEKIRDLERLVNLSENKIEQKEKYISKLESQGFFHHLMKVFKLNK